MILNYCIRNIRNYYHSGFTNNYIGINTTYSSSTNVELTVSCSKFKNNDEGISAASIVNLSPNKTLGGYTGGDNVFYDNGYAITLAGLGITSLYLEDGNNSFINTGTLINEFIYGDVKKCTPVICDFYNTSTSLKGDNNYWDPAPAGGNIANGSSTLYSLSSTFGTNPPTVLALDGTASSSFTSSCFQILSGSEPEFVTTGLPPFFKMDPATSVAETNQKNINVYPNPARDAIYIQVPAANVYVISITDLAGKRLISEQFVASGNDKLFVPLTGLADGTYFVNIISPDGSVNENRKIIILK